MATKKDNIQTAYDALVAERGAEVEREELLAYLKRVDAIIKAARAVKEVHKSALRVEQSKASRARRDERVAKALALLAEAEAQANEATVSA